MNPLAVEMYSSYGYIPVVRCMECGQPKVHDLLEDKAVCANKNCRAFDIVTWLEVQ